MTFVASVVAPWCSEEAQISCATTVAMQGSSRKRKAAATNTAAPAKKAVATPATDVFSGCHIVYWHLSHTQHQCQRVQQLGGTVEEGPSRDTTHVVCKPELSAEQLAECLAACSDQRVTEPLALSTGAVVRKPEGLSFVTQGFISQSILKRARQREADFLPLILQPVPRCQQKEAGPGAATATAAAGPAAGAAAEPGIVAGKVASQTAEPFTPRQSAEVLKDAATAAPALAGALAAPAAAIGVATAGAAAAAPAGDGLVDSSPAEPAAEAGPRQAAASEGAAVTATKAAAAAASTMSSQVDCVVERRGSEFVCVRGSKPPYSGGHTGIPWGACGVWAEPYDESSARETIEKLRNFWYGTKAPLGGVIPEPVPKPGDGNGVCTHLACAKRPFCIAAKLEEVKKLYVPGRDQFRIKALERGLHQLIQHSRPLDAEADVDAVGLGEKTAEKVKEILSRGESSRVEAAAHDKRREVLAVFNEVWGAGPATAQRWYAAGCRSLDDLRARKDLSEQQKVGLKYYDQMLRQIPRAEIAVAEGIVRQAVFELCEDWGATNVERTFAFATGSYCRGKPTSSDIDMLLCLPPSLQGCDCGAFITQLLGRLLDQGLLLDEMHPRRPHEASTVRASWMGICRPPGAPCERRIDFKLYSYALTPYAVNYFANSMSFCRATRHWANYAVTEAARRFNPAATGFKLSDQVMVPMIKRRRQRGGAASSSEDSDAAGEGGAAERELEPEVDCHSETDIFETLGLAYVPWHMRFFHDFK